MLWLLSKRASLMIIALPVLILAGCSDSLTSSPSDFKTSTKEIGKTLTPAEQKAAAEQVAVFWPNQGDRGVHVNVTGGGVAAHAPHKDAAVRFLEYLTTEDAQRLFADVVNEYPVVVGLAPNETVASFGVFTPDSVALEALGGDVRREAVQIMDRAGWK